MNVQKRNSKNSGKKDTQHPQKPVLKNGNIKTQENSTENWPVPNSQKNELQIIQGIGFATEIALNKIGILRFADFQNYTPETLAEALEEKADELCVDLKTLAELDEQLEEVDGYPKDGIIQEDSDHGFKLSGLSIHSD